MSAYWPLGGIWSKLRVTNLPAISGGIKNVTLLVFTMKVRHWILVTQGTHKDRRNFNCTKTHSSVVCQVTVGHQSQKLIFID